MGTLDGVRSRPILAALVIALGAAPASAGEPSPRRDVTLESPGGVAVGSVIVRVRVAGGVRDAEQAAFDVRTSGSWRQDSAFAMTRVGEDLFEATWDTTRWDNSVYQLEVRVWSEVPPYDPGDASTFSRTVGDVTVDNPPPAPRRLQGLTPAASARIGWPAVETSDRGDFDGYVVFARRGAACPSAIEAYRPLATVQHLVYVNDRLSPGRYCFRVASTRFSAVSGQVMSAPTPPLSVQIVAGSDPVLGLGTGTTAPPKPPPPPPLGEGELDVSDGDFVDDLPYGSQTVTSAVEGEESSSVMATEAGVDPRRTPTLVALGLVLAVLSLLLQRFLAAPPVP